MHYRPLSYFADLGLSSGLNLLSTQTDAHTHAHCDHADLLLAERDLISNMGLSYSTLLPPSFLKSVLMWLGLCACLPHAVIFLYSLFPLLSNPPSCLCCCSWGKTMLGFFSMHLCCVLIHFINPPLHGRPFPPFLISSLSLPSLRSLLFSHHSTLSSLVTLTRCHFLFKLGKCSKAGGIAACLMKHISHVTCWKAWALYFNVMFIYVHIYVKGCMVSPHVLITFSLVTNMNV